MRIVAILPDGYGGHGGIALYGRSLLRALCEHPSRPQVTAIPRVVPLPLEPMPINLRFHDEVAGDKRRYVLAALRAIVPRPNLVICGHLNLLPVAALAASAACAPLILFIYGLEAWRPHASPVVRALLPTVDAVIAIRRYTANLFSAWSGIDACAIHMLENPIALDRYGPGPPNPALLTRYGLEGKQVVLTLARVEDPHFGFDEVIDALPLLVDGLPRLQYVIAGRGHHVERLRTKAHALGVGHRVTFTGFVQNEEKVDHYRLAHVFAMPGSEPRTFDRYPLRFVVLEALACGMPVVVSRPEDPSEIPDDLPFFAVEPTEPPSVAAGIQRALERGRRAVPSGLARYDFQRFAGRLWKLVEDVVGRPPRGMSVKALEVARRMV